jgi:hypothetical protein
MIAGEVQKPVLVQRRDLPGTPARVTLALGALSLLPIIAATTSLSTDAASWARNCYGALVVAAGVVACIWLVRVQRALAASNAPLRYDYPDSGLWFMWVLPVVSSVIPAVRLAQFDGAARAAVRAEDGPNPWHGRLWQVAPWAVGWFFMMSRNWSEEALGRPQSVWLTGLTIATFALWAYIVVRLTRNTEAALMARQAR